MSLHFGHFARYSALHIVSFTNPLASGSEAGNLSTLTHLTLLLALLCNVILGLYDPWYNATACYCIFFRSHLYLSILECARGCSATECYRVLWPKKKWSVLQDALQPCFWTGPGHYHVSRGQRVPGLLLYIQWILSTQQ